MPDPNQLNTSPQKLADNPWFLDQLGRWGRGEKDEMGKPFKAPDPRKLNRTEDELFYLIRAMFDSQKYAQYASELESQKPSGAAPPPMPPPTPTPGNDITTGLGIGYGPSKAEEDYRRMVGGGQ